MSVNWSFGETILSVLQKERDRKIQQEQYAQTKAFQNRQYDLDLLKFEEYKKNLTEDNRRQQETLNETRRHNLVMEGQKDSKMPNLLLPELSDNEADYYGTREEKPMTNTIDEQGDIILGNVGYNYNISRKDYKPKGTSVNINNPPSPYVPTKDLDTLWSKLIDLNKLDKNWKTTDNDKRKIINEKGEAISYDSYDDLRTAKKKLEREVEIETDDRAKKFNSEYKGFQQIYFDLLRDPKFKSAQDKSKYIYEKMNGAPEDVIREMINLTTKRIY